ncbi:MAG: glycosyltransferase family 4 protein [Anaerolineales bacterium]
MPKKIAFIRTEPWPYANVRMIQVLQDAFPDHELTVLNVYNMVKAQPKIMIQNSLEVVKIYGRQILSRKKRFKRSFWRTPFIFRQMRKLILEALMDESYVFTFQMQSLFDASIPGIPHFLYTDHTHLANLSYPGFDRSGLYSQEWIDLEKTIYQNASRVFVWSTNVLDSVLQDYGIHSSKAVCVYPGSNAVRQDAGHGNPDRYKNKDILFVGIDWERKGGLDLLKAFKLVQRSHPDATLTIVGSSPSVDVPNCRVVGLLPVDQVGKYFQEASIFCLPTRLEPFGVVFVEAMLSKLPIVASNVGAIPDFLQDGVTGFLIHPGDVQGIASALSKLLADPQKCQQFGERGYQLAQTRFSWDAVGALIKKHILETIQKEDTDEIEQEEAFQREWL